MRAPDGTIAAAVEASRRALVGATPTPALDARVLAGHALGLDASALIAYGENRIDRRRLTTLRALIARRKRGEPVAYLVGRKDFHGVRLYVDRRVLVPRPETELLVDLVLNDRHGTAIDVLDLGTGSGAIACAIAAAMPEARVLATDVSADALEVARKNVDDLGLADSVTLLRSDLFSDIDAGRRFDVVVANLPYVADGDAKLLPTSVAEHEPAGALYGGDDGLDVYRRMLEQAPAHIAHGGTLYLECSPTNADGLQALAARSFSRAAVESTRDLAGLERAVIVRTGADPG